MAEKDFVVKNGLVVNTDLIVADGTLNRVGINNSAPDATLTVTGTANVSGNAVFGANLTVLGILSLSQLSIGSNVLVNTTSFFTGNSTANSLQTSSLISVSNSTSTANITPVNLQIGISTVNSTAVSVGSNVSVNSSSVSIGNSIVNAVINSSTISVTNGIISNSGSFNTLSVTGNTTLNNFSITISPNVVSIASSNVNIDSGVLFVDAITNRVGLNNTSPDAALTVTGSANVSGNLTVLGSFIVSGNLVTSGTQEFTGNLTPQTSGISLGNTTNRWDIFGRNGNFTANLSFGANLAINTAAIVWTGNSTTSPTITLANNGSIVIGNSTTTQIDSGITIANSSGNVQITPAGFTGNGFNVTINASNVTSGTLPNARLTSAVVNTSGNFTLSGNTTLAGSNTTISSNVNITGSFINVASAFVANTTGAYHTGTVNATSYTVGATVVANTTTLNVNGAVVNTSGGFFGGLVNATAFTTTGNANATNFNSGANLTVNSSSITWTGNSTTSPTITLANTGTIRIGNSSTTQTGSIITVANSTGNVQITPSGITGNGFNITSLNATSITNGTIPELRLPLGNATNRGALLVLDSVTNTYITDYAASANSVKTAYDVAIAANTRAASAQTAAASAFTNATTFAANATNITSGNLASARISGAYTGITQVGTLAGLVATGNINFDSGLLFVDGTNNRVGVNTTAPSVSLQIAANDAIFVPLGNTEQRPTGANGMFRFNTDTSNFEGYSNGAWGTIAGSSGGYYKGNLGAQGNTDNKANLYRINSNTQSNNITISAGENALTVGPMVIQDGINLTIEEGGRAVII